MASLDIVPQFHIARCLEMSKQLLSILEYTRMDDSDRDISELAGFEVIFEI